MTVLHALAYFFGLDNLSGPFYGFWSGAGSDVTEIGIVGVAYHHFNCHDEGCWRWGKHVRVDPGGRHVRSCTKHRKGATDGAT